MIKRVLIKALRIKEIVYCLFFQNKKAFPRKNHENAFLLLRFLGHAPPVRRRILSSHCRRLLVKAAHNLRNIVTRPAKVIQKRPCLEAVFIRQVIVDSERGNEERKYTLLKTVKSKFFVKKVRIFSRYPREITKNAFPENNSRERIFSGNFGLIPGFCGARTGECLRWRDNAIPRAYRCGREASSSRLRHWRDG